MREKWEFAAAGVNQVLRGGEGEETRGGEGEKKESMTAVGLQQRCPSIKRVPSENSADGIPV